MEFSAACKAQLGQVGLAMKTTEGEEVELPRLLVTYALAFHLLRGYSGSEWDEV